MAMFIETKANENIRADANAAGDYITVTNGYVPDYLFEIGVSSSGTVINVTSGMIIQDGVKVVINAPERVEVGKEASGTYEYKLYLKIKMNDPQNPEFVYLRSNITPQKDNVFSNMNAGINHIEIATFTRNTSGVAGLKKTLKESTLIKQFDSGWIDLTSKMTNAFKLFPGDSTGRNPQIRKTGNVVQLFALISPSTTMNANANAELLIEGAIPEDFRFKYITDTLIINSASSICKIALNPNGSAKIFTSGSVPTTGYFYVNATWIAG